MGRAPCCSKVGLHRGPWTPREDTLLTMYIQAHGEGHWRSLPKKAGLLRCGKSCRLRWMNYLRPDIKRGNITPDEEDLIIRLHSLLGNRWSLIAGRLPGRTDNEIKNYWNTHLCKRLRSQGTDPNTHKTLSEPVPDVKKRKNTKANNKSKPKIEVKKTKVHIPKPTRFTSLTLARNDSLESSTYNIRVSLSSSHGGEGGSATDVVDVPWSNFKDGNDNEVGFLVGYDQVHNLVNGSDFECQSHLPTSDNSLQQLYEEYLQLLRTDEDDQVHLDSFAESLLI